MLLLAMAGAASADHSLIEQISVGPGGQNGAEAAAFAGASDDGTHVFFTTTEQWVPEDTDSQTDVYQRAAGTTTLISTGPSGGNGSWHAYLHPDHVSDDGTRVFFRTAEPLVPEDLDEEIDIYERTAGTTTLISTGPSGGNGPYETLSHRITGDGARVFMVTPEPLVPEDSDTRNDVYERTGDVTELVSTGPLGGNGDTNANLAGFSQDGSRVFFQTTEQLTADDVNSSQQDVYERSGGAVTLISIGALESFNPSFFQDASADGTSVTFTTRSALVPEDTNGAYDGYVRQAGVTALVSADNAGNAVSGDAAVSSDGTRFLFRTATPAEPTDTDARTDLYERIGGTTTLISIGPSGGNGAFDVEFKGASDDLTHVFFATNEGLVPEDADGGSDIYERAGGITSLVSTGPAGNAEHPVFEGNSADGSRVFFNTFSSLMTSDTGIDESVYERYQGTTTHVSDPLEGGLDGSIAVDVSEDGERVYVHAFAGLTPNDTDQSADAYVLQLAVPGIYARPKGSTPMIFSLVPAFPECTSPDREHGPPLAFGSCASPTLLSQFLTVGTPDANGRAPNSINRVDLRATTGIPSTPEDEADVHVVIGTSDVRRSSDLADYTGELELEIALRLTDRDGPTEAGGAPAATTGPDLPVSVPVPCTETPDTSIGAACGLTTTVDAVVPGLVVEKRRAIWQLGAVRVLDGGADGDADTDDGQAPFLVQGAFVP